MPTFITVPEFVECYNVEYKKREDPTVFSVLYTDYQNIYGV